MAGRLKPKNMIDIEKYKTNKKTSFLADEYERLSREERAILDMSEKDPSLVSLAQEELSVLKSQKEGILKEMESILAEESTEEEFPNEIILEVRAGAGGEEAALFAQGLASMYK